MKTFFSVVLLASAVSAAILDSRGKPVAAGKQNPCPGGTTHCGTYDGVPDCCPIAAYECCTQPYSCAASCADGTRPPPTYPPPFLMHHKQQSLALLVEKSEQCAGVDCDFGCCPISGYVCCPNNPNYCVDSALVEQCPDPPATDSSAS